MEKTVNDPLRHFVEKHGVDISNVDRIVCGRKYSAVLLKNGNIGVCANLLNDIKAEKKDLFSPDLNRIEHRIILNAYFNAKLNYSNHYTKSADIFDAVDFMNYTTIAMVGLFKPLLEKFKQHGIDVHVFDKIKESSEIVPMNDGIKHIKKADAIILTATTIFNGTFWELVNTTGDNCDILLLGPSSIMHRDMFKYKNIKKIFGSIFKPHDERVLETIQKGHGTRAFLQLGQKVCLSKEAEPETP